MSPRKTTRRAPVSKRTLALQDLPVVYVHGIGQQAAPQECKKSWDIALFGQDMGERTHMAYWADIRHVPTPRTLSVRQQFDALVEAGPGDLADSFGGADIPPRARGAAERYSRELERELLARAQVVAARAPRTRVLPLPGWIRRRITEVITRLLVRDTAAYFFDAEQREAMRERLRSRLRPLGKPCIVVAHSQGSIIAYEVLRELGNAVQVELLVTIGSPLGLTEVQDQLAKPLRVPAPVRAWRNFADLLDPVALDKSLGSEFQPKGFVKDERVVNQDSRQIIGFNPHSALGYLSTDEVRAALGPRRERIRRFFLAKDVAAEISDDTRRHAVLLELQDVAYGKATPARAAAPVRSGATAATLDARRDTVVTALRQLVGKSHEAARIDPLKRFISARLTAQEILALQREQERLPVYCIWKNSRKRKLVKRSAQVIHVTPARVSYAAYGAGIHWAVLDTGIQSSHPHFKTHDTIAKVWDCTGVGAPRAVPIPKARDGDGHGTHVAGIIAGREPGTNPLSSGMAPLAKVHAYQVLDESGSGEDGWIIKALDHIATLNESASQLVIQGVNLSLGSYFDPEVYGCGHSPICAELRRLWQQGVVVCVACGNEGAVTVSTAEGEVDLTMDLSIGDPANLEEAIAVGSVNADKPHFFGVSYFSSRGPTADGRAKPDLVAPGERIASANARYSGSKTSRASMYVEESGTSMACPHVSGMLAAFLSVRREFIGHPDQLKKLLLSTCTDLGRDRYHQGAGLPNLIKMLTST